MACRQMGSMRDDARQNIARSREAYRTQFHAFPIYYFFCISFITSVINTCLLTSRQKELSVVNSTFLMQSQTIPPKHFLDQKI
jgi:hypothetical protein